jgi:hypothetical protein
MSHTPLQQSDADHQREHDRGIDHALRCSVTN